MQNVTNRLGYTPNKMGDLLFTDRTLCYSVYTRLLLQCLTASLLHLVFVHSFGGLYLFAGACRYEKRFHNIELVLQNHHAARNLKHGSGLTAICCCGTKTREVAQSVTKNILILLCGQKVYFLCGRDKS